MLTRITADPPGALMQIDPSVAELAQSLLELEAHFRLVREQTRRMAGDLNECLTYASTDVELDAYQQQQEVQMAEQQKRHDEEHGWLQQKLDQVWPSSPITQPQYEPRRSLMLLWPLVRSMLSAWLRRLRGVMIRGRLAASEGRHNQDKAADGRCSHITRAVARLQQARPEWTLEPSEQLQATA